jgi:predicted transposase YdaD
LAATYVLLGLRYSREFAQALFQEVLGMKESITYQAIVSEGREEGREEGRAEEARRLLQLQGQTKFGPPDAAVRAAIESISDLQQLEELGVRLISAASWQELLPVPAKRRRNGRRSARG